MQSTPQSPTKKLLIPIIVFVAVIVGISVLAMNGVFHRNPYGNAIKINNYRKYFSHLDIDYYDRATSTLYDMVSESFDDNTAIPKSGALIRDNSVAEREDEATGLSYSSFIVDIPDLERTYAVSFTVALDDADNSSLVYPVIVLCPSKSILIYPDFPCADMNTTNSPTASFYEKYSFLNQLPITVSKYNDKTEYINYVISYKIDEKAETIKFTITDNTGNGHSDALATLRNLGADTNSLTIEYIDASNSSSNMSPGRPSGN